MKKNLFPLLFVVLGLSSCGALSELTKFDMPFTQSVTIQKNLVVANIPIDITTPGIETKSADFFTKNNIKTDLIDKITLRKMELSITTPTTGNFKFLKTINISILSDSLPEIKIASLTEIPISAGDTLDLTVDPTDLKQYIIKDKIKLKITITAKETITSDYTIDLKPTFLIDLKVLGL